MEGIDSDSQDNNEVQAQTHRRRRKKNGTKMNKPGAINKDANRYGENFIGFATTQQP